MRKPTFISERLEQLLTPISIASPSGESLAYDALYDQIKEARREDIDLPQGEWITPLKKADWKLARSLCLDALTGRTKDLQIAVWLLEAMLRLDGYAGVRDGLQLLHSLCGQFWDTLWPAIEDGDLDMRLSPFNWVNDKLTPLLALIPPVTAPSGANIEAYTYADLQAGLAAESQKQEPSAEYVTYAKFLTSVGHTQAEFFQATQEELADCLSEFGVLTQVLDTRCGRYSPSLTRFRSMLNEIHQAVVKIIQETGGSSNKTANRENTEEFYMAEEETADKNGSDKTVSISPIRSRAEAYRRLAEAADYLLRTEPHSPTPYLVKRAVAWGKLPLNELLVELVNDQQDLAALYALLGMKKG
jgi:type VI secretion system protein ImpA